MQEDSRGNGLLRTLAFAVEASWPSYIHWTQICHMRNDLQAFGILLGTSVLQQQLLLGPCCCCLLLPACAVGAISAHFFRRGDAVCYFGSTTKVAKGVTPLQARVAHAHTHTRSVAAQPSQPSQPGLASPASLPTSETGTIEDLGRASGVPLLSS